MSSGGPFIITREVSMGAGPFTVEFYMKSNNRGSSQVFWITLRGQDGKTLQT